MQKTKSGPSSATTQNAGIMKKDPSIQELNAPHADGISREKKSHSVLKFYHPHITITCLGSTLIYFINAYIQFAKDKRVIHPNSGTS